ILHPSSFILHPSSFILHPSSFILHPSSLSPLIRFCVREPFVVLIAVVVIVASGAWCAQMVPIDAIPNVGENQVIVLTAWPG
ncbi:MAG TPA: hypothetical protein PLR25_29065, partial [Planctomycetaceae bacterium]|nr:hypothetical protein [Planctomycetaceae bacterium]